MRIATPRHSPGIQSPPGAAIAVGLMAVMGLYGFTTTLQKSLADRRASVAAVRGEDRDIRLASAVGPTPALVYALSDAPPPSPQVVRRSAPPRLPEPVIEAEPTPVVLTAVASAQSAGAIPGAAPSAEESAVNVSTVEPPPQESAPRP